MRVDIYIFTLIWLQNAKIWPRGLYKPRVWYLERETWCFLPSASCLMLPASCFLPHASCLLLPASCFLPPASCLLLPASCFLPPASCLLLPASCFLPSASLYRIEKTWKKRVESTLRIKCALCLGYNLNNKLKGENRRVILSPPHSLTPTSIVCLLYTPIQRVPLPGDVRKWNDYPCCTILLGDVGLINIKCKHSLHK